MPYLFNLKSAVKSLFFLIIFFFSTATVGLNLKCLTCRGSNLVASSDTRHHLCSTCGEYYFSPYITINNARWAAQGCKNFAGKIIGHTVLNPKLYLLVALAAGTTFGLTYFGGMQTLNLITCNLPGLFYLMPDVSDLCNIGCIGNSYLLEPLQETLKYIALATTSSCLLLEGYTRCCPKQSPSICIVSPNISAECNFNIFKSSDLTSLLEIYFNSPRQKKRTNFQYFLLSLASYYFSNRENTTQENQARAYITKKWEELEAQEVKDYERKSTKLNELKTEIKGLKNMFSSKAIGIMTLGKKGWTIKALSYSYETSEYLLIDPFSGFYVFQEIMEDDLFHHFEKTLTTSQAKHFHVITLYTKDKGYTLRSQTHTTVCSPSSSTHNTTLRFHKTNNTTKSRTFNPLRYRSLRSNPTLDLQKKS